MVWKRIKKKTFIKSHTFLITILVITNQQSSMTISTQVQLNIYYISVIIKGFVAIAEQWESLKSDASSSVSKINSYRKLTPFCLKAQGRGVDEQGIGLLLYSQPELGSRSMHGWVFLLHFYYVWQWWQCSVHCIKWQMRTFLPLVHTASIFLSRLLSESQSYKKHAEWEFRLARAKITHEFQISRVAEGELTTQGRKNKKGYMFRS